MRPSRDDGAVAILVAVFATVAFAFLAILVDLGGARVIKQDAVGAADAASLAGAAQLDDCITTFPRRCPEATQAVKDVATANFGVGPPLNWATCTATPPAGWTWRRNQSGTNCIRYGYLGGTTGRKPDVVFVAIPVRKSPVSFGALVSGFSGVSVSAASVAGTEATSVTPCALCVRGSLQLTGNLTVDGGGSLYVGHVVAPSAATVLAPAGTFLTDPLPGGIAMTFLPSPPTVTGRAVADPFGASPTPPTAPALPGPTQDSTCSGGTLLAGTYRRLTVTGSCKLNGVYEFHGDVTVNGQLTIATATSHASISLVAGADLVVTSGNLTLNRDPSTRYAIFADGAVTITSGSADVGGDVYVPNAALQVSSGTFNASGIVFADAFQVSGGQASVTSPGGATPQEGTPDIALVR
jgi:hypothetical protein